MDYHPVYIESTLYLDKLNFSNSLCNLLASFMSLKLTSHLFNFCLLRGIQTHEK